MNTSQLYILMSIIVLAIIMVILVATKKTMQKPLSKLVIFAFIFIIAGIIFGENRILGYSLMGLGMVLAIIDIVKKLKKPSVKND